MDYIAVGAGALGAVAVISDAVYCCEWCAFYAVALDPAAVFAVVSAAGVVSFVAAVAANAVAVDCCKDALYADAAFVIDVCCCCSTI